jgi:hypothetical protein
MRRLTRRTWIGVGVGVLGEAALTRLRAQPATTAPAATGGEPYRRDGGPSDTRVRLTRDLLLMEGHAVVFDALIAAKDWAAARQRVDDATLELRERLEPYMKGQGIKPFAPIVATALAAIDARDPTAARAANSALQSRIAEADRAFSKFRRPDHAFVVRALVEALKVAGKSYDAAVDNGVIAQAADYRDGRGIFVAVERRRAALNADLSRADAAAAARLAASIEPLRRAWPSAAPPATPPLLPADVLAFVEAVEAAAEPLFPKIP